MARTWLSVTVELLGGRGTELWPWPGRVFAVGPAHTFRDLATAVDDAFARWDRSHQSFFTLDDGRVVADRPTVTTRRRHAPPFRIRCSSAGGRPAQREIRELDMGEVRGSIASADADRFLDAVTGCDLDDALQQVGPGIPMALRKRRERAEPVAVSVIDRLTRREETGDAELAEELLASLRGEPAPGRPVAVDLEMLSDQMEAIRADRPAGSST
ncbi:hypothetical protein [Gordonia sp. NPDC058843]|uniref:hypothetical protein n=1 Tax=Gordonia sp. NPDC058843 TaxID=3346648 RepID=UPI0036C7C673